MRIRAFTALRPPAALAPAVASPPYDVVTTEEARALASSNPMSFLHVIRPEVDLPADTDPYHEAVYRKAAENFDAFRKRGYLQPAPHAAIYLYRQEMGAHRQEGIVTVCHIEDYERDVIRKHEKTRPWTEEDRVRHVEAINANAGPVFLTYPDRLEIEELWRPAKNEEALYDFEADDGVRHTVWEIRDAEPFVEAFGRVEHAYVADGHHRSASAVRVGRRKREANPRHTGDEEYNWFLTVLFPSKQLKVLPYNRVVRDLNGMTPSAFLEAVRRRFVVTPDADPSPPHAGAFRMYLGGQWYALAPHEPPAPDPVGGLDVSILQDRLLAPVLGVADPRSDPRVSFVGGIRGTHELEKRVGSGQASVAFSLYPTTIEQLMAVADAGQVMPPKSTWFEPKLRSGLFVHTLE